MTKKGLNFSLVKTFVTHYHAFWDNIFIRIGTKLHRQIVLIPSFNFTSRYLDDLLNVDNPYFQEMVTQIYLNEVQLNKTDFYWYQSHFLDLHLINF